MTTIIGFTEENTICDCCGKSELKGTYQVIINDCSVYYGSTCAKRNLGLTSKEFTKKINSDKKDRIFKAYEENSKLIEQLEKESSTIEWPNQRLREISEEKTKIKEEIAVKYNLKYSDF